MRSLLGCSLAVSRPVAHGQGLITTSRPAGYPSLSAGNQNPAVGLRERRQRHNSPRLWARRRRRAGAPERLRRARAWRRPCARACAVVAGSRLDAAGRAAPACGRPSSEPRRERGIDPSRQQQHRPRPDEAEAAVSPGEIAMPCASTRPGAASVCTLRSLRPLPVPPMAMTASASSSAKRRCKARVRSSACIRQHRPRGRDRARDQSRRRHRARRRPPPASAPGECAARGPPRCAMPAAARTATSTRAQPFARAPQDRSGATSRVRRQHAFAGATAASDLEPAAACDHGVERRDRVGRRAAAARRHRRDRRRRQRRRRIGAGVGGRVRTARAKPSRSASAAAGSAGARDDIGREHASTRGRDRRPRAARPA